MTHDPDLRLALVPCPLCGRDRPVVNPRAARTQQCRACFLHSIDDVDQAAVQRLLSGSPVTASRAERQAAVVALSANQVPTRVIAERLHVTKRTVQRLRARAVAA